jgi:hypothetical protein
MGQLARFRGGRVKPPRFVKTFAIARLVQFGFAPCRNASEALALRRRVLRAER